MSEGVATSHGGGESVPASSRVRRLSSPCRVNSSFMRRRAPGSGLAEGVWVRPRRSSFVCYQCLPASWRHGKQPMLLLLVLLGAQAQASTPLPLGELQRELVGGIDPYPDASALLEIKKTLYANVPSHFGQPPVNILDGWNDISNPCNPQDTWLGLTCSPNQRVIGLSLPFSRLGGPIPEGLSQLTLLQSLDLSTNHFNGSVPDFLSTLHYLTSLDLTFNQLEETIPSAFSALIRLKDLRLGSNQLGGNFPTVLTMMSSLVYLDLSNNNLVGQVPDLSNLFYLEHLILTANELDGNLPTWLDQLASLVEVNLRNNKLSGQMPDFQNALALEKLYLGFNNLTGSIPSTLGSLTSLDTLFFPSNSLQGTIPSTFASLTYLSQLDLSSNPELGGPIPDFLGELHQLALLQLTGCSFNGTLTSDLGTLLNLKELYLDDNLLTGTVPAALGNLTQLTQLYLSDNQLTGSIPEELCLISGLQNLNLANNQLNGSLPSCLFSLSSLSSLVLSDNLLSGTVPTPTNPDLTFVFDNNCFSNADNQLKTCAPSSIPAVPHTHSEPAASPTPDSSSPPPGSPAPQIITSVQIPNTSSGLPSWLWLIIVLLTFALMAIFVYSFSYHITALAGAMTNRTDQLPVTEFSLSKIKKATRNFTTMYGRGSFGTVYLGEDFRRGHAEPRVIIKRANEPQKMGDFLFKCKVEVLARARHRYLVNLLGYCIGKGERILVYEFLPNGTLFDRLHRPELEPLPWDVRVRIAVSVACALEHLHHGLTPPLVHRAVTSSNILLAADMSAKLSDFGIARGSLGHASSFEDTPRRRSKARGGPGGSGAGAAAAGSGAGAGKAATASDPSASPAAILQLEKVDVYGFGVVLLELITGQKAMKEVHITSVAAPFLEDAQMMPLMVDPQLGGYFNQQELIELACIARDCVKDDPLARPSMRDVLQCMEDRLQLDPTIFENLESTGEDMLTDGYAHSMSITSVGVGMGGGMGMGVGVGGMTGVGPITHMRHLANAAAPAWHALESFAMAVRNAVLSPQGGAGGARGYSQPDRNGRGNEDFEMSSLLIVGGSDSSLAESSHH